MYPHDHAPSVPEGFQIVIGSLLAFEDVDNYVTEIDEYPTIGRRAFHALRQTAAHILGFQLNGLHQGTQLRLRFATDDDKVISKNGLRVDIQHENIDTLFVLQGIDQ